MTQIKKERERERDRERERKRGEGGRGRERAEPWGGRGELTQEYGSAHEYNFQTVCDKNHKKIYYWSACGCPIPSTKRERERR